MQGRGQVDLAQFSPMVSYLHCQKSSTLCHTAHTDWKSAGTQTSEPTHNPTTKLSKDCLKSHIIQGLKQQVVLWSFRITHLIFLKNEIEQPLTEEDHKVHQLRCDQKTANQFSHKVDDTICSLESSSASSEILFPPLSLSLSPFSLLPFVRIQSLTCQVKYSF